ncbi:hypothetical protein ACIQVT_32625 [Streptomyces sp. NPDC100445]|uniref:EF-Tu C-terminal domain-related protein n=1 Tax=Streptomyces sp. NPDC100445 TaxID=3366102 RepID=UPI00382615CE
MGGRVDGSGPDAVERPFLMVVEDVFPARRGAVMVTGRVERGRVREREPVEIVGPAGRPTAAAVVAGIEGNGVWIAEAGAELNVGVALDGVAAADVARGQVLAAPGSIAAHRHFTADIAVLSAEQGGADVFSGDRLRVHVRAAAVQGTVTLPEGTDVVRPVHAAAVTPALEEAVALEVGQSFAFRHHGRAAGSGTVTGLGR